jgi:rhodanese-related sulfurtransferase
MPIPVTRHELEGLLPNAQLVEVLPEDEYLSEHLPGAISLPLRSLTADSARQLDPARPVIVYCWDAL